MELILQFMSNKLKARLIFYIGFLTVFLLVWFILHLLFENLQSPFKGLISAGAAVFLGPRLKTIETQSGKKMQLIWFFYRKSIIF